MDFYKRISINLLTIWGFLYCCHAREIQAEILKGVTIRNWPYADRLSGKYEGFAVDLTNEIANIVGFEYRLYFSPDGKYGAVQDNKVNGMIGEVFNGRADFAVADITVTEIRKKFVDFTEPFTENGIAILIRKSNVGNIKSFKDLAEQSDIQYGTYRMGATYNLFSNSNDPTIKTMHTYMSRNPGVLVNNAKEGVDRVNTTRYGFIVESSFAEFLTGMYCDLTYITDKSNYFPRQYAIAMPKDSIYTEKFNNAIKKIKANGVLDKLKARYWKNRCDENNTNNIDNKEKNTIKWADKGYDVSGVENVYNHQNLLIVFVVLQTFNFVIFF